MSDKLPRAPVNDTVKMSLISEVDGKCPLCRRNLIQRKKDSQKPVRVFDVAHIYPLHATDSEVELLKGEDVLCDDIDSEDNFIALCKECHKIYDTQKTVEEYRKLVEVKKNIKKIRKLSESWDAQTLHKDISIIASNISKLNPQALEETKLSYKALKVSEKTNDTFGDMNEMKVNMFVVSYYTPIKESLRRLELQHKARSQFIYSQVRSYYLALLIENFNQSEIFDMMCNWFMVNTGINDKAKSEVLVSYFIQNCEIFSDDPSK